jgi:predicted ATP-dependent Lon-type protease
MNNLVESSIMEARELLQNLTYRQPTDAERVRLEQLKEIMVEIVDDFLVDEKTAKEAAATFLQISEIRPARVDRQYTRPIPETPVTVTWRGKRLPARGIS